MHCGKRLATTLGVALLSGCSLAPFIQQGAVEYNTALNEFDDQVLVTNILRARDYVPINVSELSTITGSLSAQATLGASIPFGPHQSGSNTLSPQLSVGSTPTFNMADINTSGFELSMMQPVSPIYVATKSNSNYPMQLLLLLFVKSIRFSDGSMFVNDPDDETSVREFTKLVESMVSTGQVELKPLMILDPLGPPFPLGTSHSATLSTGTGTGTPTSGSSTSDDMSGFTFVQSLNDGQLHVGNADCAQNQDKDKKKTVCSKGQLYREYTGEVALCLKLQDDMFEKHSIYSESTLSKVEELSQSGLIGNGPNELEIAKGAVAAIQPLKGKKPNPGGPTGGNQNQSGAMKSSAQGAAAGPAAAGGGQSAVSVVLQIGRVSAILGEQACAPEQLVLPPTTEKEFEKHSSKFAQVEWRSTTEIIQYLGAVSRHPDRVNWGPEKSKHKLFAIDSSSEGRITVTYRGRIFGIADEISNPQDHSLQVLAIVSELVNTAKISSDIPVNPQLQIIP